MDKIRLGYALCGSFCTFEKSIEELIKLKESDKYDIFPIMSETAYNTDTRFGNPKCFISRIEKICGKEIIHSIVSAEPLGPKRMVDILLILPCTGNTLSKLSNAITDTAVTMAAKSVLRVKIPVVIGLASNDSLSGNAQNIGRLLNTKNYYFIPFSQDEPFNKPTSAICDFTKADETIQKALCGEQIEPILF